MQQYTKPNRKQRGVTILELMIVVVIIAIMSSVAYPSYMRYLVSSKRTAATSALLQVSDKQQQFFMDNKSFADDLTQLGLPANPHIISDDGMAAAADDADAVYSLSLSNIAAATYTITAAPLNNQLAQDTDCGSLTLDQAGVRGTSGAGEDCWR